MNLLEATDKWLPKEKECAIEHTGSRLGGKENCGLCLDVYIWNNCLSEIKALLKSISVSEGKVKKGLVKYFIDNMQTDIGYEEVQAGLSKAIANQDIFTKGEDNG